MDITGCSSTTLGGNKYVQMKMDFGSGKKWCTLIKKKSDGVKDGIDFVDWMNAIRNMVPKYIRVDNAEKIRKHCKLSLKNIQQLFQNLLLKIHHSKMVE